MLLSRMAGNLFPLSGICWNCIATHKQFRDCLCITIGSRHAEMEQINETCDTGSSYTESSDLMFIFEQANEVEDQMSKDIKTDVTV